MNSALPKNIAYLRPLFRLLKADAPDGLDESRDNADIDYFLAQRVQGLDASRGAQTLQEDRETLSQWLKSRPSHPGHYLIGYLSLADDPNAVATLQAKGVPAEAPTKKRAQRVGRLKMATPARFKLHRVSGALVFFEDADRPRCAAVAVAIPHATAEKYSRAWIQGGARLSDVSFGSVSGKRYLLSDKPNYLFSFEKGAVHFSIDAGTSGFDESHFIAAISTLAIE